MHKLESVIENEPYKILRVYFIKMDQPIQITRPVIVLTRKKKVDFVIATKYKVKVKVK